jgi:DNA-binding PadR family transcriptional regulator
VRLQSDTKAIVLAILADRPAHGYAVVKVVREKSGGKLRLSEGQLYPVLYALEAAGWVTAEWENGDPESRRRIYAITEAGRAELADRTQRWSDFAAIVSRLLRPDATTEAKS